MLASPTTAATSKPKFIGIVSVDIPSQVETSQLLLNRVFILTAGLLAGSLAIIVFYLITTRLFLQPVRVLQGIGKAGGGHDLEPFDPGEKLEGDRLDRHLRHREKKREHREAE